MRKIAIPSREGLVDQHFGHCEYFTIYSVNDAREIVGEERFTPPPACGCKSDLVSTLRDMGVSDLIAGNMGEGAAVKLGQGGITVIRGASGPVHEAVEAWLHGRLHDSRELCLDHGHECLHPL